MCYSCLLEKPVPVKVHDAICRKRAGKAIDNIMNYYGFRIFMKGYYFAIQEEGASPSIVSFQELVNMSTYLLEKAIKDKSIKPAIKVKMMMSYQYLKKLKLELQDKKNNRLCLKCGSKGSVVKFKSASLDRVVESFCCPVCMGKDALEHFQPYRIKRNL